MNTKILMRAVLALTLAGVAVVAAACGNDDSTSGTDSNATDRAFVRQMIPHHEMAVEMAKTAQKRSKRAEVTTLADNIVSTQNQEIEQLRKIANRLDVKPDAMMMSGVHSEVMMDDAKTLGVSMNDMGMSMDIDALATAKPFDRAFIDEMIPHHEGAIAMAKAELANGNDPELQRIARAIVTAQKREIANMNTWRSRWYGAPSQNGGPPA